MENKTAKQIVNGYKVKCALVAALWVILAAIFIYIFVSVNTLVGIVGLVILAVNARIPFKKLLEKDIECVIYDKLDPKTYNEILELGVGKKNVHLQVLGAMSAGEHDKVLQIVAEREKKKTHPVERCSDIYRKGFVYFEKEDWDNLLACVREYEKLKKDNPKFTYIFDNFTVFEKYDAFLDEDYEYVIDVCDIDIKENDPKNISHKITRINVSFYRAVSLYKMGRIDEAKAGFEEIIAFAPKMHKAKLSKEYLDMMN